jgi:hypothetical protein
MSGRLKSRTDFSIPAMREVMRSDRQIYRKRTTPTVVAQAMERSRTIPEQNSLVRKKTVAGLRSVEKRARNLARISDQGASRHRSATHTAEVPSRPPSKVGHADRVDGNDSGAAGSNRVHQGNVGDREEACARDEA